METDNKHSCFFPWNAMSIDFSGNVSVACCKYKFGGYRLQPGEKLSIETIWNNAWFENLRRCFLENDLAQSGCEGCPYNRMPREAIHPPHGMNRLQEQNFAKALTAWHTERLHVESLPTLYQLDFGRECNLNCIMCPQTEVRNAFSDTFKYPRLLESILSEFDRIALAEKVVVFGGEPLFIPESRKFIKAFLCDPKMDDVELHLVTNGILLHDFFEEMKHQKKLLVSFSMDALGAAYERIRRGARWGRLEKNLNTYASLRKTGHPSWALRINTVLMRSAIADLCDIVRLAVKLDVDAMSIRPLVPTRRTRDEDILALPRKSAEFNWCKKEIEAALKFLEDRGKASWCSGLQDMLRKMESPAQPLDTKQGNVKLDNRLVDLLLNKKVMVWGTGSYYRVWVADWLERNCAAFHFMGFVDNDPLRWEKKLDGFDIYSPEALETMGDIDYILVANPQVETIRRQVDGMGIDTKVL